MNNIGLSLSGGGVRAVVFHIGMLKFLAENKKLSHVKYISSVSGGSLLVGLIYNINQGKWPNNQEFLEKTLPRLEYYLTNRSLLNPLLLLRFLSLHFFTFIILLIFNRRKLLSKLISQNWEINTKFSDLEKNVVWDICATTRETGNMWRIKQNEMGDHTLGYTNKNDLSLSDVMSISAAFPIGIGPFKIKIKDYKWHKYMSNEPIQPQRKKINIYDGGVYDNMALEGLYDISCCEIKERTRCDFIIVSDASAPLKIKTGFLTMARLTDIFMNNINKLRKRNLINYIIKTQKGMYLEYGSSINDILRKAQKDTRYQLSNNINDLNFDDRKIDRIRYYGTNLFVISKKNFNTIVDYGYTLSKAISTLINIKIKP